MTVRVVMQCVYERHFSWVVSSWDRISTSSSYFRPEGINEQVYAVWIMEKMTYNSLAVAIAVATDIMLATSGSATSVLAQQYTAPNAGNPSSNSPVKSGNTTSTGGMINRPAAGNAI
ncbi:MAG: hypothetical protein WCF23_19350 [Candidatus Nitrosopolaris sp.]